MSEPYIRKMVILREEQSGHRADAARPCAGRALLEAGGAQGKLTLSVQNLKPGQVYTLYLIEAGDAESIGIPLGRFMATERGRADERLLFDAGPDGTRVNDRAVVALVAGNNPLTAPLVGAVNPSVSGAFVWRGNFKEFIFPTPECGCPAETAPVPEPEPIPAPEPMPEPTPEPEPVPLPETLPEPPSAIPLPEEEPETTPEPVTPGEDLPGEARPSLPQNGFPPDIEESPAENIPTEEEQEEALEEPAPAPLRFEILQSVDIHEHFTAAVADFHATDTLFIACPAEETAPQTPEADTPHPPIEETPPAEETVPIPEPPPVEEAPPLEETPPSEEKTLPSGKELLDIWKLFETNTPVAPFEKQNVDVQWVRISLDELKQLPFDMPRLLDSDFLRKSYEQNNHLILGKLSQGIMTRFVLGVPGLYDENEHRAAARLGFRQFKTLDGEPAAAGTPGYWLLII